MNLCQFPSITTARSTFPKKSDPYFAFGNGHLICSFLTSNGSYNVLSIEQNISVSFGKPLPSIKIGPPVPSDGPLLGTALKML